MIPEPQSVWAVIQPSGDVEFRDPQGRTLPSAPELSESDCSALADAMADVVAACDEGDPFAGPLCDGWGPASPDDNACIHLSCWILTMDRPGMLGWRHEPAK